MTSEEGSKLREALDEAQKITNAAAAQMEALKRIAFALPKDDRLFEEEHGPVALMFRAQAIGAIHETARILNGSVGV